MGLRFSSSLSENAKSKARIAAATAELVPDGATVFLNVGSTTTFIAEQLRIRRGLSVLHHLQDEQEVQAQHHDNSNEAVFLGKSREDKICVRYG